MESSVIPFIDLNLIPDSPPPASTATSTGGGDATTFAAITPKIEPKTEPFDDPIEFREPFLPSPNSHLSNSSSNNSNQLGGVNHGGGGGVGGVDRAAQPLSNGGGDHSSNVYSEFYRISELFRSAFAQKTMDTATVVEMVTAEKDKGREMTEMKMNGDAVEALDAESGAIVPVNEETQVSTTVIVRRKYVTRSAELVRVTDLSIDDQRYFRDLMRRTRMIYDSVRIYWMVAEEKKRLMGLRRIRGDLKAAALMGDRGLWLNRDKRIVGAIPGVYIGDLFFFRMELCVVGLHGQPQAGIDYVTATHSANGEPIATSVIVSGGYEDDEDSGDQLVYTGHGGQDKYGKQCGNQKLEGGNLALERSMHYGIEVRVIRGIKYDGAITSKVYVYDGLYRVVESWFDIGKAGFGVYKFKLVRNDGQPDMGSSILRYAANLRAQPLTVRPTGYISLDISLKKENVPIFLYNDIDTDHEPLYYEYLPRTVFPPFAFNQGVSGTGCECVSGCGDGCLCAMKNGGEFAYDHNGILLRGKPLIFECGSLCQCPPGCRNRISQKGVRHRLEVFRSQETGWGVRSLDVIPAGGFICEYAGVFLTRDQASVFTMNGDTLIYPNRFTDRWTEWGDLSQIFSDFVRPMYPSIPPLDFAMDVSRMRNVACYISHSSSPNVLVQFVLYDHNNTYFPHLMLFALETIPPLRELSLDYGVADEWTGKPPLTICN